MSKELVELQKLMKQEQGWEEQWARLLDMETSHLCALLSNQDEASEKEKARIKKLLDTISQHMAMKEQLVDILYFEQLRRIGKSIHVKRRIAFLEAVKYLALCFKDDDARKEETYEF